MLRLPVMVAAGGINSAGRTSRRHAYRRMIWDHLSATDRSGTEAALVQMMGTADSSTLLKHTLVREIEKDWFDHRAVPWHRRAQVSADQAQGLFDYNPGGIGEGEVIGGQTSSLDDKRVRVTLGPSLTCCYPASASLT